VRWYWSKHSHSWRDEYGHAPHTISPVLLLEKAAETRRAYQAGSVRLYEVRRDRPGFKA
jgi:hypothetical protein